MKIKVLVGILVLLIIVNLATIGTYLYYSIRHERAGAGPPPDLMMRLNEEQRLKLADLMRRFDDDTRPVHEKLRGLEDGLLAMFRKEPVSRKSIEMRLKEISDLRLELGKQAAIKMIEAKSFLQPDQEEEFFDAILRSRPDLPRPPGPGMRPHPDDVHGLRPGDDGPPPRGPGPPPDP
jgi:hypothetical protein